MITTISQTIIEWFLWHPTSAIVAHKFQRYDPPGCGTGVQPEASGQGRYGGVVADHRRFSIGAWKFQADVDPTGEWCWFD